MHCTVYTALYNLLSAVPYKALGNTWTTIMIGHKKELGKKVVTKMLHFHYHQYTKAILSVGPQRTVKLP